MIFYDSMPEFDLHKPVTTINSVEMLIPVQRTGLPVVLSLVLVHLLLLCSTMVLFHLKTRASDLGNAWQAIAQIISAETRAVVEEAGMVRDKDVEAWLGRRVFLDGCMLYQRQILGAERRLWNKRCDRHRKVSSALDSAIFLQVKLWTYYSGRCISLTL
ncbi:hypothetical protein FVEG_16327 [Fusarium verticillioides 7600]|uniref:Uncharacterized protein n=1 Tax=Gibberella moniliformis (strain M3125 / FGSC 7600) TaxID=334819 RepID=W7MWD2_GIBM7|nr:hypothetical protein FVEG_16327 [Fusarium verticillioides 7600]EWG48777.1 hypothetical protein FVEG_16327 [Fusarium verticillioides 7600]